MKCRFPRLFVSMILLCVVWLSRPVAGQATASQPAADSVHIVLMHVNDVHGHLEQRTENGKSIGGYGRLASAVDQVRKADPAQRVFLIHAGDEFSRGDALTTATFGQANVAIMNQVGFDIWTLGNGEFYSGMQSLHTRITEAKCKVLAANVIYKLTKQPIANPYVIEQVGDVKIAFLGLCFVRKEHPSAFALNILDPMETARRLVPELRKQADVVVAVDHLGLFADQQIAANVPGIDVIIGGHTHTTLPEGNCVKNPDGQWVLIGQAGEYLRYVGRIDLTLNRQEGRWQVVEKTARLIPLNDKIPIDPAVTALIAKLSAATQPAPGQSVRPKVKVPAYDD